MSVILLDAIILAAGGASRMGVPKALLPAGPNHTLLSRVVGLALGAVDGAVLVVVGHEREMMRVEIARCAAAGGGAARVTTVENAAYAQGQSTSLQAAIRQVRAEGALVLLVDQPAITRDELARLVRAWQDREPHVRAVASASHGQQRTPVILGAALFPEMLRLAGDVGARRVLREHASQMQLIERLDETWHMDVDTWTDYVRLARALGWDREQPDAPVVAPHTTLEATWASLSAREADPSSRLAGLRRLTTAMLRSSVPATED